MFLNFKNKKTEEGLQNLMKIVKTKELVHKFFPEQIQLNLPEEAANVVKIIILLNKNNWSIKRILSLMIKNN